MKLSHYTTITEGNIHLIAFRIKQFIERMETIGMQNQYPTNKLMKQIFGDINRNTDLEVITQSQVSYLSKNDYLLEIDRDIRDNSPYIRINFQLGCNGMLLKVGDKVRITPNRFYIHQPHVIQKSNEAFPRKVWFKGNEDNCHYQAETNKA